MRLPPLVAALALHGLEGIGPVRYRALVDRHGSAAAALVSNRSRLPDPAPAARAAREVLERCRADRIEVLCYGGANYPRALHDLPDPPPVLYLLGRSELLAGRCVAVVGSRRATAYGRRVARRLGSLLAGSGCCVVSGMAMGCDAEAHRGALPGPTAAVLGSGVDVPSPARNRALHASIREHGVVVSEFAPGTRAEPHHFPRRNRIIAALASEVVIVEASRRSGALITAELALDLGREVRAVPGPVDSPNSAGANLLIADGADPVLDLDGPPGAPAEGKLPADPGMRALLTALGPAPVTPEEAAELAGRSAEEVAPLLTMLELRGHLIATRDGRVMRTPGGSAERSGPAPMQRASNAARAPSAD